MAVNITAPSTGRRRFAILVIICLVSFITFTFYWRTEDFKSFQNFITPNFVDKTDPHIHIIDSNGVDLTSDSKRHKNKPVEIKQSPKSIETQKEDFYDDDDDAFDFIQKGLNQKSMRLQNGDAEFSGPTEDDDDAIFAVTLPAKRHDAALEAEFSGPTENDDDDVFMVTMPVHLPKDFEMENSGPTEEEDIAQAATKSIVLATTKKPEAVLEATTTSEKKITNPMKTPGFILDTPTCKVPKLDPWDPTVKHLIESKQPYECPGPPLFVRSTPDGAIALDENILMDHYKLMPDEIDCNYVPFFRKHEDEGKVRENDFITGNKTALKFGEPLKEDYIAVMCQLGNKSFEHYFPLVHLKKDIEDPRSAIPPPNPRLNVVLLGVDSISKLNFLRHFPRTHKVLKEKLSPFTMNGYTKVGDNTFPNLVPLLTGHFVEYYWNETLRDTMYFDSIDLIWKDYAKKGYRTFYAEDSPYTGTFNYIKRGFYDPPTDYYLRPIALALEYSKVKETSKSHCYNSQLETDLIYDFLRDFVKAMDVRPYHAFAMVSTLTHDYLNNAGYADLPVATVLEDLHKNDVFNKSMLVIFGDHGLRFGKIRETYIGKFEERMPFMYINFPQWFLDQHPQFAQNLRTNQNRLMTLFDIHATMIHLLDLKQTHEQISAKSFGSSLLNELSPNRTCPEANILPHWCPCNTYQEIPLTDAIAVNVSQALVDDINFKLKDYSELCATLEVEKVLDVRLGQANDLVLTFVRHDNVVVNRTVVYGNKVESIGDYMVTLTTKPGGAVFEGTVRHNPETDTFSILGISRINMYGKTSWCIESQKMKIYCYCKEQLKS